MCKALLDPKNKGDQTKVYEAYNPGTSHKAAIAAASRFFSKPINQQRIAQLAAEQGLTPGKVLAKLSSLTEAEKTLIHKDRIHMIPDNNIQLQALVVYMKATGMLTSVNNVSITNNTNTVTINSKEDIELLGNIANKLSNINDKLDLDSNTIVDIIPEE